MKARTFLFAGLIVLLTAAALAQPGVAPAGAGLVDRISALRLGLERIEDARVAIEAQRDGLVVRHETLAAEIQQRKTRPQAGGLLPDFELQQKLRLSQELSENLTLLNREIEALRQARRDRLEQLALAYDLLVDQTAARALSAVGRQRSALLSLLAKARQERDLVRKLLMPARQIPRTLQAAELLASDDPDELAEQTDVVRDEQDRLRRELARLDERTHQLQKERHLDLQMRDFITDQEIFDEGSRLLLLPRASSADTLAPGSDQAADPDRAGGKHDDTADGDFWGDPGPTLDGAAGNEGAGGAPTGLDASNASGSGMPAGRLPVGLAADGQGDSPGGQDDLRSVRMQREAIVRRLKELQNVQDRLQEKIDALTRD